LCKRNLIRGSKLIIMSLLQKHKTDTIEKTQNSAEVFYIL